jgi:PIN domain nuclease of toxin-antitoxin system
MKVLLDTHTFVWWDEDPSRLSTTALSYCSDLTNELILGVASLWEMQIKRQIGKLTLRLPITEILSSQQKSNLLIVLPILPAHIFTLDKLPAVHKDPFDRLLLAQAISEGVQS